MTICYRGSQGPLKLLIDSTAIKTEGEGEWSARKHGSAKRRLWRKIPAHAETGSITAEWPHDTRKCHDAVTYRRANAVIPPRTNAKPWKPSTEGCIARNEALRASKYLGRDIW